MTFDVLGAHPRWMAVFILLVLAALVAAGVTCGGDDDGDGIGSSADGNEDELTRLADLAETDALDAGGVFRDTGFAVYCRQNSGYDGSPFEQVGFMPTGSQARDEFCYNVSDDRTKVGLSRRSASSGTGSCLVVTAANGSVTRSEIRSLGESDVCTP